MVRCWGEWPSGWLLTRRKLVVCKTLPFPFLLRKEKPRNRSITRAGVPFDTSCQLFYGWAFFGPSRPVFTLVVAECNCPKRLAPLHICRSVRPSGRPALRAPTNSQLILLALCIFCFCLALNVAGVYYNYLDFRYHWSALEISFFYSSLGVMLALTSSVGIRFLVPKLLSEGQGILLGLTLQVRLCFFLCTD